VAPSVDGAPFPTTFWLTCPRMVAAASVLESAGEQREWTARAMDEPEFAARLLDADAAYREARAREGAGIDPCASVGIAGQADPMAVKCLHARVAAAIAGTGDPVGEGLLGRPEFADAVPCGVADRCGVADS
jgi:hypothetical protein